MPLQDLHQVGGEAVYDMVDFGVGVSTVNTYEVKRVDTDYFGDE